MDSELRGMVMAYRVTELQALLGFAGKNKTGRKNELQARALELVKVKSPPIIMKIRELYRSIQISNFSQPLNPSVVATASSLLSASKGGSSASSYGASSYSSDTKLVGESPSFGRSVGYHRVIGGDGQYRTVPICPDIKMKELPFYDIMATLLRPTSLLNQGQSPKQEAQHSFCLSPSQAGEITNSREVVHIDGLYNNTKVQYQNQVQLRFCALDSTEEQDDLFPQGLVVKVNGRIVQLPTPIPSNRPGVEPKRPSKPLNITANVKCCPLTTNTIHVTWLADQQQHRSYCMLITMVRKLTADQLFARLKTKRIQPADFTRGRIKEITTAEEEDLCAPTSIRVSVACPLGKSRMTYPCRATTCKHLQCFDANLFLLMNERKPTFVCPVCNKHLKFGDLCIDGYFMDVIKNLSIDAGNDIELFADGSWLPAIKVKSESEDVGPPSKRIKSSEPPKETASGGLNETISLDDDIAIIALIDEDMKSSEQPSTSNSSQARAPAAEPEIIDLIDSSDDEDDNSKGPSTGSGHRTTLFQHDEETETVQSVLSHQPPQQQGGDDGDDTEEEVGIRPRRRTAKISYVEESSSDSTSTNEGDAAVAPVTSRQPRSPACIELSDSGSPTPSPENIRRPFASVGSGSTSAGQASSAANNNRSGSGSSSTIYSSSGMATTTAIPTAVVAPIGAGNSNASHHLIPYPYSHPSYYSSTYSLSSSLSASSSSASSSGVHHAVHHQGSASATASAFFPSNMSVPGYTAYDAGARVIHASTMSAATSSSIPSWDDDLNSFISPQTVNYTGATLDSMNPANSSLFDDILNATTSHAVSGHHPFSASSTSSAAGMYHPHSGGGGGMSGFAGGWM